MKSMRKIIALLGMTSTLVSCAEVYFTEPQPAGFKNLTQIPAQLHGQYNPPATMRGGSTITIENKSITDSRGKGGFLSDSLIIREIKGYLVVNKLEKNEDKPQIRGNWSVFLIKINQTGNLEITPFTAPGEEKESYFTYLSEHYKTEAITQIFSWDYVEEPEPGSIPKPIAPKDYKAILLTLSAEEFIELMDSEYLPNATIFKNAKND